MRIIADLHIHSKYSRACSPDLVLPKIAEWCCYKGINLVVTGDFTHPAWFKDIKEQLEPEDNGMFKLKKSFSFGDSSTKIRMTNSKDFTRFILGTEISCIYKQGDKCRRVHHNIFFPEIKDVEQFNKTLEKMGCNLKSDGRPIIGLSSIQLAEIVFNINDKAILIPAHAWTPWFSIFGSKSGFDSIEECFDIYSPYIYAVETGLSSDPPMNWRLSALDNILLVSNSDAHSLPNLGREANVFEWETPSYDEFYNTLKNRDKNKFKYTIEFYPEEGKYHLDGHAACKVVMEAKETKKNKGLCPVCKKPLTIGVLNRVDQIADREVGELNGHIPYKSLVPLQEIIAESFNVGKSSKRVQNEYFSMIEKGGSEFAILLDKNFDELKEITKPEVVEAIKRVRQGKLFIEPGYDGVYGKVKIYKNNEERGAVQKSLI
ncbi:MAG TPA: DNA helicase UvrD [Candidatus Uhrbacteria bacterium]|nr:DNA helicase UvrD [Candidatus Uhrbacteria bacterium]